MAERPVEPRQDPAVDAALAALGSRGPSLAIDGLAVADLAERFGTPCYVYSAATLRARLARTLAALGPRVRLLWSIKANPSLALTRILRAGGAGAEIASLGELQLALAAGHAAADLRFAGPGKTDAELAAALAAGLGCVHAESLDELDALARQATAAMPAGVAVRVNLPGEASGSRLRMSGTSARFGIDVELVPDALATIARSPALRLRGLHAYGGTQCFAAATFASQARRLAEHAAAWERAHGVELRELDVGGGFGVAAYCGDPGFDLAAAAAGLQQCLRDHDRPDRTWFVELGRWLAAPAGIYLTRVVRLRQSGGRRYAVVDGGLHQCAAAAGVGTVLRRPPLLVHATALDRAATAAIAVGGPLCTPADQFADDVRMPDVQVGDLLAILHAGAYGLTYSPTGFLSHATPAEVLVEDGAARVIRERGRPEDVLARQHP